LAALLLLADVLAGFAWSSDSYQLAALDASSNMKMWWMRPEEREDGEQHKHRQKHGHWTDLMFVACAVAFRVARQCAPLQVPCRWLVFMCQSGAVQQPKQ
jgi:hypothetical protein